MNVQSVLTNIPSTINDYYTIVALNFVDWPQLSTFPDSTGVVLGTRDDRVALVVEGAAEYFISMSLQNLKTVSIFCVPYPSRLVRGGREDPRALRIETNFRYFAFVTVQDGLTRARHRVVHPTRPVRRGSNDLGSYCVESHVEDLIVVSSKRVYARAALHIPHLHTSLPSQLSWESIDDLPCMCGRWSRRCRGRRRS